MKQGTAGCTRLITFGQLLKLVPYMCLRFITPHKWEHICILLSIPHLLRAAPRWYWLSGTFREFISTLPWYVGKAGRSDFQAQTYIWGYLEESMVLCWAAQCLLQSIFLTMHPLSTILNLAHLVIDASVMYGLLHLKERETEMETETKDIVSSAALAVGIPSALNTLFSAKHSKIPLKFVLHFGSSRLITLWHKSDMYSYRSDLFIMPLLSSCYCPFRATAGDRSTKIYPSEYPKLQASLPTHYLIATRSHLMIIEIIPIRIAAPFFSCLYHTGRSQMTNSIYVVRFNRTFISFLSGSILILENWTNTMEKRVPRCIFENDDEWIHF